MTHQKDTPLAARLQSHLSQELPRDEHEAIDHMLQTDPSIRQQWHDLQAQDEAIMAQLRTIQIEPSADDVEAALARFHRRHTAQPEASPSMTPPKPSGWWERLAQLWQSQLSMAMAACVAVGLVVLVMTPPPSAWKPAGQPLPQRGAPGPATPPIMRAKGTAQSSQREKQAYLYLGTVAKSGKVTRLGTGEACGADQRLYFAFQLKASGYPYLLLREKHSGKTLRLYPFTAKPALWQQGYHEIQREGTPQLYRLQRHRGPVAFALLWSPTPLAQDAVDAIQQRCDPFAQPEQRCDYLSHHHPKSSLDVVLLTIRSQSQRKQP